VEEVTHSSDVHVAYDSLSLHSSVLRYTDN